eukprot:146837-Chlamydomonas_euryale.AAC.1
MQPSPAKTAPWLPPRSHLQGELVVHDGVTLDGREVRAPLQGLFVPSTGRLTAVLTRQSGLRPMLPELLRPGGWLLSQASLPPGGSGGGVGGSGSGGSSGGGGGSGGS